DVKHGTFSLEYRCKGTPNRFAIERRWFDSKGKTHVVQTRMIRACGTDVLWNVDHDWTRPAGPREMKRFAHYARQIAWIAHEIIVFYAGPRDADRIDLLKRVSADQVFWHLTGDHHERR